MFKPVTGVNQFFKKMNFIFNTLVAGPLAMFIILYLEYKTSKSPNSTIEDEVSYLLIGLVIGAIIFAEFDFWRKVTPITNIEPLPSRLTRYLDIFLIRGVLAEVATLVALLGLYLTYSNYFIIAFFVAFGYLSLVRPTNRKLSRHLKFNKKDIEMMEKWAEFKENES